MLTERETQWIYHRAYLPEHLPDYVSAVSGAEPFLQDNYIYFLKKKHLIFIGYPLEPDSGPPAHVYDLLCDRLKPATAAVMAEALWLPPDQCEDHTSDRYFRLHLPVNPPDAAVSYMIRRAQRELEISAGSFGKEHRKIVKAFLARQKFNRRQKSLFKRIAEYLRGSHSARLIEARKAGKLVAFNIVDLGAADYAFYVFSFRSGKINVPGASDLLFDELLELAQSAGKKAVNLGLGINAGIRHFKEKWGGVPFLDYFSAFVDRRDVDIGSLAKKL